MIRRYIIYSLFVFGYFSVHGMQLGLQDQVGQLNTLFEIIINCSAADSQEDLLSFVSEIDEILVQIDSEIAKFENSSFSQIKLAVAVQVLFERIRSMVTEAQNSIDDVKNFVAWIKMASDFKNQVFTLLADIDPANESINNSKDTGFENNMAIVTTFRLHNCFCSKSDKELLSMIERYTKPEHKSIYPKSTSIESPEEQSLQASSSLVDIEHTSVLQGEFESIIVPMLLRAVNCFKNEKESQYSNEIVDWLMQNHSLKTDIASSHLEKARKGMYDFLTEKKYNKKSFRRLLNELISQYTEPKTCTTVGLLGFLKQLGQGGITV